MSKDKESWDTVFADNLAFPRMEHERIKGILSTLKDKLTTIKNKPGVSTVLVRALLDLIETGDEHLINQYIDSL